MRDMKVDINRLKDLRAQLAAMERRLEELVMLSTREATRVAQSTKSQYREHDIVADCEAVVSCSEELRNQGARLSEMMRAKVRGLERAIELYSRSEQNRRQMLSMWTNDTFARVCRFSWTSRFTGLNKVIQNRSNYGSYWIKQGYNKISQERRDQQKTHNSRRNLSVPAGTFDYGQLRQCYLGIKQSTWTVNAMNRGWGPISKAEYDRRERDLSAISLTFPTVIGAVPPVKENPYHKKPKVRTLELISIQSIQDDLAPLKKELYALPLDADVQQAFKNTTYVAANFSGIAYASEFVANTQDLVSISNIIESLPDESTKKAVEQAQMITFWSPSNILQIGELYQKIRTQKPLKTLWDIIPTANNISEVFHSYSKLVNVGEEGKKRKEGEPH